MGDTHFGRRQVSLGDGQGRPAGCDQRLRGVERGDQRIRGLGLAQRLIEACLRVIPGSASVIDLLGRDITLRHQGQEPGERRFGQSQVGAGALHLLGSNRGIRLLGRDGATLSVARRLGESQVRRDLRHGELMGLEIERKQPIALGDALVPATSPSHALATPRPPRTMNRYDSR